jgi:GntR family transcriptional regulator
MSASLPIYHQIRNKIQDWIINKEYGLGEQIPSETDLAKTFNVTRITVRQAISLLVQEGLLTRKRGSGTFVTNDAKLIGSFGLDFTGFMDGLFLQVSKTKTYSAKIEVIATPRSVKEKLNIEDEEIVKIERVRTMNGQIFALTINYIPKEIGLKIEEKTLFEKPLLKIMEVDLGVEFDEAFQTIEASFSDQHVSDQLEIENGTPILFVERIMYGKKKRPIELVQTSYRGDIYKYVFRLKLDKSNKNGRWIPCDV